MYAFLAETGEQGLRASYGKAAMAASDAAHLAQLLKNRPYPGSR
jgi:hypothetical protein